MDSRRKAGVEGVATTAVKMSSLILTLAHLTSTTSPVRPYRRRTAWRLPRASKLCSIMIRVLPSRCSPTQPCQQACSRPMIEHWRLNIGRALTALELCCSQQYPCYSWTCTSSVRCHFMPANVWSESRHHSCLCCSSGPTGVSSQTWLALT